MIMMMKTRKCDNVFTIVTPMSNLITLSNICIKCQKLNELLKYEK